MVIRQCQTVALNDIPMLFWNSMSYYSRSSLWVEIATWNLKVSIILPLMKWSKTSHRDVHMRAGTWYKIHSAILVPGWKFKYPQPLQRVIEFQNLRCCPNVTFLNKQMEAHIVIWHSHCHKPNVNSKSYLSWATDYCSFYLIVLRLRKHKSIICPVDTNK